MAFSNYLQEALLDLVFGDQAWTVPATLYVGLSSTAPAADGTGITEPSGGAYARVAVANNTTNWPSATVSGGSSSVSNGTAIPFPTATADWGTVDYYFIADAATAGNVLGFTALTSSQTISTNDVASFAVGTLVISLT